MTLNFYYQIENRMQLFIRHFLYNQIKDIIEHRNDRQYIVKHGLEVMAYLFMLLRCTLGLCSFFFSSLPPYWLHDPWIYYLHQSYDNDFMLYTIIMMMPDLFGILGAYTYCFQRVDTITYLIFYDLLVINRHQIQSCTIGNNQQNEILNECYLNNLAKIKQQKFLWNIPPVKYLLKQICWLWTKYTMEFDVKVINKAKIGKLKLKTIPNISIDLRLKIALITVNLDRIYYLLTCFKGISNQLTEYSNLIIEFHFSYIQFNHTRSIRIICDGSVSISPFISIYFVDIGSIIIDKQ